MSKLEVITNLYSNKESFCHGFLHKFHKSQFLFFNCKNYLKKQSQGQKSQFFFFYSMNYLKKQDLHCMLLHGWLFKDWPLDYHNSGQVWELWPIPLTTQWPEQCPVSSRHWCIGCASGVEAWWLWFGTLKTNLHFPSTFFAMYFVWTIVEPGWCLYSFFCDWMFLSFSEFCSKIKFDCDIFPYFSLSWNFWLPMHSYSVFINYCSIEAALVQYQILLKEVMLNQKVVHYSWYMIKTSACIKYFWAIFVMYLAKLNTRPKFFTKKIA